MKQTSQRRKFSPLGKAIREMGMRNWEILAREFGVGVLMVNPAGKTMTVFQSGLARLGNHLGREE